MVVQLRARSEECFFVASNARQGSTCVVAWQTQFGAVLDIDVDIHDPRESLMYSALQAPEGQTSFTANHGGRYRICFSNVNNGKHPKFVAFRIDCHEIPDAEELKAQPQQRREGDSGQRQNPISYHMLPNLAQKDAVGELTSDLSVLDLHLMNVIVEQRLFHSKLKAHRQIVNLTNDNVLLWRTVMCVCVAVATLVQMWYVKRLFDKKLQQLAASAAPPTPAAPGAAATAAAAAAGSASATLPDATSAVADATRQ